MSYDPEDLDKLLGAMAKEGRLQPEVDPEEHTDSATLYAYYEDKLNPEQRSRVEEHLSLCGRCRDLVAEYEEFLGDSPGEESEPERRGRVADFGAAAEWQRLRERIREAEQKSQPSRFRRFFGSAKTAYSIAAMLALALIGLSLYVTNLRRAMNEPDLSPIWLQFSESTRATDGQVETLVVPAGEEKTLVFDIPAPEDESKDVYRLEIYYEDQRLFGPSELKKEDEDEDFFTIAWKSSDLKAGLYELQIFKIRKGNLESIEKYKFKIRNR